MISSENNIVINHTLFFTLSFFSFNIMSWDCFMDQTFLLFKWLSSRVFYSTALLWFNWSSVGKWASLVAQMVKNLPAMQKTWVRSLDQEDLLEKEIATRSSTLPWRIPWTEEPGSLQSKGLQRAEHNWTTNIFIFHFLLFFKIFIFTLFYFTIQYCKCVAKPMQYCKVK